MVRMMFKKVVAFFGSNKSKKVVHKPRRDHSLMTSLTRRNSNHNPHQGEGEKARRRMQIAKGMLRISNGLVVKNV